MSIVIVAIFLSKRYALVSFLLFDSKLIQAVNIIFKLIQTTLARTGTWATFHSIILLRLARVLHPDSEPKFSSWSMSYLRCMKAIIEVCTVLAYLRKLDHCHGCVIFGKFRMSDADVGSQNLSKRYFCNMMVSVTLLDAVRGAMFRFHWNN